MFATSLGGDATLRLLTMPFADPKKIEQVLGYELESQILGELDGLVYDSVISTTRLGEAGTSTTNVIAVAAQKDVVRALVESLSAIGAEPRVVGAAALSYAALRGHAYGAAEPGGDAETLAIVDFGHLHTNVCVVRGGTILFARSIPRGGEDVTVAIAEQFRMSPADAVAAKHAQAFLGAPGRRLRLAGAPARRRRGARGVASAVARAQADPGRLPRLGRPRGPIACSSPAAPRGSAASSSTSRTSSASWSRASRWSPTIRSSIRRWPSARAAARRLVGLELPAQALGLALAAAAPVPQVNLRKADLAYRTDYSYLRGKAGYLAAAILAILAFAAINAAASLRGLRKEGEALGGAACVARPPSCSASRASTARRCRRSCAAAPRAARRRCRP